MPTDAVEPSSPVSPDLVAERLQKHLAPHPRLLLADATVPGVRQRAERDALLRVLWDRHAGAADTLLSAAPLERRMQGRRLLAVSREALERVLTLALAYRCGGDVRHRDAARDVLLTVAAFTDWNPSHFLDVAEMTAAVAIGYDWLHGVLSEADRATLRTAILEKGVNPSFEARSAGWVAATNNWNQVCHAGMVLGALAVAEDEPALCARVIARAVANLPAAMKQYAPDGAYPEGPTYWSYGTSFNVLLIAALESAIGTDFDLSTQPGFLASANYFQFMLGPSGNHFNYSDGRPGAGYAPSVSAVWIAAKQSDPSLVYVQRQRLTRALAEGISLRDRESDRLTSLLFVWSTGLSEVAVPDRRHYVGRGEVPVAVHRSSWDDEATYVGIKGGSPSASHAHMDVGSFLLDGQGVRWAADLGMQEYNSLESIGVKLWDARQGGKRWSVFRLGQMSHNILTVDGREQVVSASAPIERSTPEFTIVDCSPVYAGQLATAKRGVRLRPDGSVRVQDEISGIATGTARKVRWAMMTPADVEIGDDHSAVLSLKGKRLRLHVDVAAPVALTTYPAEQGPQPFDAPNPGMKLIGFEVDLAPGAALTIIVDLEPDGVVQRDAARSPLSAW